MDLELAEIASAFWNEDQQIQFQWQISHQDQRTASFYDNFNSWNLLALGYGSRFFMIISQVLNFELNLEQKQKDNFEQSIKKSHDTKFKLVKKI